MDNSQTKKCGIRRMVRLLELARMRDNTVNPAEQKNISILLESFCKFHGHPLRPSLERCFCDKADTDVS